MEHWWGGGEGLLLQLLEAILAWRKMSNLTTAHWKCWSCQYQWSSSTEGQTPNCPGFSWTILIVVSMFSGFPSAGAGIYTTEGSVNNSPASSNYLSHHPTFPCPALHVPTALSLVLFLIPQIWEPTENPALFGFKWLSFFHSVKDTLPERQTRCSTTVTTFN